MIAFGAIAASLIAEALAAYTLAEWMTAGYEPGRQHALGAWAFCIIALTAFLLPRGIQVLALSTRSAVVVTGAVTFAVLYGVLRLDFSGDLAIWEFGWVADFMRDSEATIKDGSPSILAAMLAGGLWVRSAIRAADDIDMELMPRSLGITFAAVTAIMVAATASDRSAEVARAGAGFYAMAVVALAFSQLALSGASIGDVRAGGITAVLIGGTIAAAVAGVALFGLVFAILGPIIGPPFGVAVEAVLTVILTPPAWLLSKLFEAILGNSNPFAELRPATMSGARQANEGVDRGSSPWTEAAVYGLRALALIVVAAVAAGVVVFLSRLRRRMAEMRSEVTRTASAGSFGQDARALVRGLFRRRGQATADGEGAVRLYREVLERAEASGYPREPGSTPNEFAPTLVAAFHAPVTDEITAAFEQARYAGREPEAARLADLERRWRHLRSEP